MSHPNKFQRLKGMKDRLDFLKSRGLENNNEYHILEQEYNELMGSMPKYRPHVWRKYGL